MMRTMWTPRKRIGLLTTMAYLKNLAYRWLIWSFQIFSASENLETGMIYLALEHESPVLAYRWLTKIIVGLNEEIRRQDVEQAKRSVEYLKNKVTELVSLDNVFSQLIEDQTKTMMVAYASEDYLFEVIEPPVISEFRSKPKRALLLSPALR